MSHKFSGRESINIVHFPKKNKRKMIIPTELDILNKDQQEIVAIYKEKIGSRKPRIKTI